MRQRLSVNVLIQAREIGISVPAPPSLRSRYDRCPSVPFNPFICSSTAAGVGCFVLFSLWRSLMQVVTTRPYQYVQE